MYLVNITRLVNRYSIPIVFKMLVFELKNVIHMYVVLKAA